MQITPDQIRAARAMLDLDKRALAERARKPFETITAAEEWDRIGCVNQSDLQDIRLVLEQSGIEFIPWGVRKRPALTAEQQALYEELRAISLESAAELSGRDMLTDDDLYDQNGLPA